MRNKLLTLVAMLFAVVLTAGHVYASDITTVGAPEIGGASLNTGLGLLAAGVVMSAMSARKMRAGDVAATARVRLGRIVAVVSLLAIVVFAVLAFG